MFFQTGLFSRYSAHFCFGKKGYVFLLFLKLKIFSKTYQIEEAIRRAKSQTALICKSESMATTETSESADSFATIGLCSLKVFNKKAWLI